MILIGVSDDGQILGLDQDYMSLGDADKDEFELHLRDILNRNFGTALVTTRVQIRFQGVGDKELCQIDIQAFDEPVLVEVADTNGQPHERFYLRSGNSSRELSKADMLIYLKERLN